MPRNLTVKFLQISPEALFLLPSGDGEAILRGTLRAYKVVFEESVVRFAGRDVKAFKIGMNDGIRYIQLEMRAREGNYSVFINTNMNERIVFKVDHYVYVDAEPLKVV